MHGPSAGADNRHKKPCGHLTAGFFMARPVGGCEHTFPYMLVQIVTHRCR